MKKLHILASRTGFLILTATSQALAHSPTRGEQPPSFEVDDAYLVLDDQNNGLGENLRATGTLTGPDVAGLQVEDGSPALREALGYAGVPGALVMRLLPDSRAARCGLRAGDLILTVDGEPLGSADAARQLSDEREAAHKLVVRRRELRLEMDL